METIPSAICCGSRGRVGVRLRLRLKVRVRARVRGRGRVRVRVRVEGLVEVHVLVVLGDHTQRDLLGVEG